MIGGKKKQKPKHKYRDQTTMELCNKGNHKSRLIGILNKSGCALAYTDIT